MPFFSLYNHPYKCIRIIIDLREAYLSTDSIYVSMGLNHEERIKSEVYNTQVLIKIKRKYDKHS